MVARCIQHRSDCPSYQEAEHSRQLSIRLAYSGVLLAGAIQASLSITSGSGGYSISPLLSFTSIVPCDAPAFRIFDTDIPETLFASDLEATFASRLRELSRLYSSRKANPRDVDKDGNNVLHVGVVQGMIMD